MVSYPGGALIHQWVQVIKELAADERQEGPVRPKSSYSNEQLETKTGLSWWPESRDIQASTPLSLFLDPELPSATLLSSEPSLSHVPQHMCVNIGCAFLRMGCTRRKVTVNGHIEATGPR